MKTNLISLVVVAVFFSACGGGGQLLPDGGMTGGGAGGGAVGGGSGGGAAGFTCTSGAVFAGNPTHPDPMVRPAEGTGLLEDPPFPYRTLIFTAGQMITHDGQEIWRANLSDGKLHKVAGTEAGQALITGPCAGARFSNIFGIALASDGSLYVSDQTANAILKITDPLGAGCTVSHLAGTPMDVQPGIITPVNPPNVGNVDGPGASAKFGLPERMVLDATGNIYVWDFGNDSIRKIANDADHTVSTFLPNIGGAALVTSTFLNGKIYMWGKFSNDVFLWELDPATPGVKREIFKGRASLFGGNSSDSLSQGGIVNDGTALIVFFNGQLFRITTTGTVSAPLAGKYQPGLTFSSNYDPHVSHPAASLEVPQLSLFATAGVHSFLAINETQDLFISTRDENTYVLKVDCAR